MILADAKFNLRFFCEKSGTPTVSGFFEEESHMGGRA
jgi:hypothetical protein